MQTFKFSHPKKPSHDAKYFKSYNKKIYALERWQTKRDFIHDLHHMAIIGYKMKIQCKNKKTIEMHTC